MDEVIEDLAAELQSIEQGRFQINDMDNILARCRAIMADVFGVNSKEAAIVQSAFLPQDTAYNIGNDNWVKACAVSGLGQTISYLKGKRDAIKVASARSLFATKADQSKEQLNGCVFIVHGHDDAMREMVARLVEKLGLEPIVLFERPNGGKTVIEKFEKESNVGFAIALLTADDTAICKRNQEQETRARQNVVFELGYFVAKLGRDRVAVLKQSGVAEPSDLHGIVYTELDSRGAWKFELAKELRAAGFEIDMNKAF